MLQPVRGGASSLSLPPSGSAHPPATGGGGGDRRHLYHAHDSAQQTRGGTSFALIMPWDLLTCTCHQGHPPMCYPGEERGQALPNATAIKEWGHLSYTHSISTSSPILSRQATGTALWNLVPDEELGQLSTVLRNPHCLTRQPIDINITFGGNSEHRHQHRPQLQQNHKPRHGLW